MEKNIIDELWAFIKKEKEKNKIAKNVYDWFNEDNLWGVIVIDNQSLYLSFTSSSTKMPNHIYAYVKRWAMNKGYKYIYN